MSRRWLLASLAAVLSACADVSSGPSSAGDPALRQVGTAAAPAPSSSCTVYPQGLQYSAVVTWSRIPTRTLRFIKLTLPSTSSDYSLRHRTRSGSVTVTLDFAPHVVFLSTGGPEYVSQNCSWTT